MNKRKEFMFDALMFGLMLVVLGMLTSCSDDNYTFQNIIEEEKQVDYSGYWFFNKGGELEITSDSLERFDLRTFSNLVTQNPETPTNRATFGTIPSFSSSDRRQKSDGSIVFSLDLNYTDGNDVESDSLGDNIRGRKRTDFEFSLENETLKLTIKIYSDESKNNPNFILANRTFEANQ